MGFAIPRRRDPETEMLMREIADASKAKGELEGKMAEVQTSYMVAESQLKDPAAIDMMVDEMMAADPNMSMMNQELMELKYQLNSKRHHEARPLAGGRSFAGVRSMPSSSKSPSTSADEAADVRPGKGQAESATAIAPQGVPDSRRRAAAQIAALDKAITEKKETLDAKIQRRSNSKSVPPNSSSSSRSPAT